jgi:phenylacetate-CoA ligase
VSARYDDFEAREPSQRERDQFVGLPGLISWAMRAPGWAKHLAGVDAQSVTSRAVFARLPLLRKSDLIVLQKATPPFGGFDLLPERKFARMFMSPGPIFEPEADWEGKGGGDIYGTARALFAAGFRPGEIVHNAFSYHLTPGAFIFESGLKALGCVVINAGTGNTDGQIEAIAHLRPIGYAGTPDFLKILVDAADKAGKDVSSLRRALVSGAALPASLRAELGARGIAVKQCYAVAEAGVIAYESEAGDGLIINEHLIVEIVRPGTGDPVPDGEVGEVVVTTFRDDYPMIRLATGDLSAVMPGVSACGRTNRRLRGWMGRADQTTKVKGMFVHPAQVAEIGRRHPGLGRLRLVVSRDNEQDVMTLLAESASGDAGLVAAVADSLQAVTKLRGTVSLTAPGSLPNDGKVIADERPLG